ncbi:MAG: dihydroxyacetone kinase subunit DhaK [Acidimicrobiales bacterium]
MRGLLNDVGDAVDEALDGLLAAHGDRLARWPGHPRVICRARPKSAGGVGLAIANGSGHEPIAVGWVGEGLLDANACGDVFTAPPPALVAEAVAAAETGGGVVLLISNHAGDRMNGELGAELARAAGHRVEVLVMGDDLATAPPDRRADRRGAPGTTFAYKVAGAAAEAGAPIEEVVAVGRRVLAATSTLALTVAAGTSPLTGRRMAEVPAGEVLVGSGVHGEGGAGRIAMGPADELVDHVVDRLLADLAAAEDPDVLVLVNGFGATPLLQLLVVHRRVDARLRAAGLVPYRPLVAELVTTADTAGCSISVARTDAELRRLWSAPCSAPYFPPVT